MRRGVSGDSLWQLGAQLSQLCGQASPLCGCCEPGLAPEAHLVIQHSSCGMRAHCGVPRAADMCQGLGPHRAGAQKGAIAGHKERAQWGGRRHQAGTRHHCYMVTAVSTGHKVTTVVMPQHRPQALSCPPMPGPAWLFILLSCVGPWGPLPSMTKLWALLELCMRHGIAADTWLLPPSGGCGGRTGIWRFVVH